MDIIESTSSREAVAPSIRLPEPRVRRGRGRVDKVYRWVSLVCSLTLVLVLVAIVAALLATAWPGIGQIGLGLFTGTVRNPGINAYGALPFIVGTVITTVLALVIAVPISMAIAVLLTEYAPAALAAVLGVIIDVAAGVPTIVFGVWALLVLVPWMSATGEPAVAAILGWLPIFNQDNPGELSGYGMLTTGLVLAAMVFPTIVSVTRNTFLATPQELREASLGLGATRWETATRVVLRQGRSGVAGAIVLASGRALGETMAVVFIIGTVARLPHSLFDQGYTISAFLITQLFGGAASPGTIPTAALYELGLVLLALSLLTSIGGRVLTRRLASVVAVPGGLR